MSESLKVVLDTNVLEAAVRSRNGASYAVLSRVGMGQFEIAISVALVLEYEDVLMRKADSTRRTASAMTAIVDYLCEVGQRQSIFFLWRPCLRDPKDDLVLELAVAAGCNAIVTHNRRDFEPANQFGMDVWTPAQFLRRLGEIT